MKFHYDSIKEHIRRDSLDDAIIELKGLLNSQKSKDFSLQVTMIESRLKELKSSNNKGTIDKKYYSLELNRIKFSVLQLADEIKNTSQRFLSSKQGITIKKIQEEKKINLNFKKELTNELFEIEANPHTEVAELCHQILISFEPNYEDGFLFKENRMLIKVKKNKRNGEKMPLLNDRTLIQNNLVDGDIISIEFELREDRASYMNPPTNPPSNLDVNFD